VKVVSITNRLQVLMTKWVPYRFIYNSFSCESVAKPISYFCLYKLIYLLSSVLSKLNVAESSYLYYKHFTIVNEAYNCPSASNAIIWSVTLESSIMILEVSFTPVSYVYSTGINYDDCQLTIIICS
jgi:hypothetical protein